MNFPVVARRQVYYYGRGFDRLEENGTVVMMLKSVRKNDKDILNKLGVTIPEHTKNVTLDFKYYVYEITPLSETRSKLRIITNSDPNMKFLPQSILNFVARKFAYVYIQKLEERGENSNFAGSPWEKAMNENRLFYDWIDTRVDSYLRNLK